MPEAPGERKCAGIEHGLFPGIGIDLDFDGGDRCRPPSHPRNPIAPIPLCYSRWSRFQQQFSYRGFDAGCLAIVLFLANGDIITSHEAAHETCVAHLDTTQPLYIGDAIPT